MREFLFICALLAGLPAVSSAVFGQAQQPQPVQVLPRTVEDRPPPPTEPSVPGAVGGEKAIQSPAAKKAPRVSDSATPRKLRPGKEHVGQAQMPPPDVLVMMLRGVIVAVNQANFTENYSVLHGLMTPTMQARVKPPHLANAFANLRKQAQDLSPALLLAPQYTQPPSLSPRNELRAVGAFAARPQQIQFSISWRPFDGIWMVESISLSTAPAPSIAQAPQGSIPVLSDKQDSTPTQPAGAPRQ